jgi:hypothetical protein
MTETATKKSVKREHPSDGDVRYRYFYCDAAQVHGALFTMVT